MAASALRTASSSTACSNLSTINVPPEKSMPSGIPRIAIITRPAAMTTVERAMACHLQRMKL
jgi:hypothetical protein